MAEKIWTSMPPDESCGPFLAKLRGGNEVVVSYHCTIPISLHHLNRKSGWKCHRTKRFVQPLLFAPYADLGHD